MHPDATIAALRREHDRLDTTAEDYKERAAAIIREIEFADGQERPETAPGAPDTLVDRTERYLRGLRHELDRAPKDRHKEIKAEIKAVEDARDAEPVEEDDVNDETVSPEEIEQRRQQRTGQGVQQARNAPVPGQPAPPAVETAPESAEEQTQ